MSGGQTYNPNDYVGDSIGVYQAGTPGAAGPDTLDDTHSRVSAGVRWGANTTNTVLQIYKNVGAVGGAAGPIGTGALFVMDTAFTAYEANDDLGKTQSQIGVLKQLKEAHAPGGAVKQETHDIIDWLIHKFERRNRYNTAGSAGYSQAKGYVKESWAEGTRAGRAKAVAAGTAYGVAALPGAVLGQAGSRLTRFGRGALKKTGLMGSQRKGYAQRLYELATGNPADPLARKVITLVMTKGLSDQSQIAALKKTIDDTMTRAIAKAMSSYAGS